MPSQDLVQLAYVSRYSHGRAASPLQALRDIVSTSKRNNARDGITGYLVFDGSGFLQILEGESAAVVATYRRIAEDQRHLHVENIGSRSADRRDFAGWSMAGYMRREQENAIFERHAVTGPITEASWSLDQAIALAGELAAAQKD